MRRTETNIAGLSKAWKEIKDLDSVENVTICYWPKIFYKWSTSSNSDHDFGLKVYYQPDIDFDQEPCMHDGCPKCHGTGRKKDGSLCIHHLSCPCPKCTPRY